MGSLSGFTEIPDLTPLERIGPKGYLRYVFPFQLPEDYNHEQAASILRAGYEAAQQRIAVLGCEAVPNPDAKQAGILKLQRLRHGDIEGITVKDLRAPGAFPMTYKELKSKNFPVASFDANTICRRSVWATPDERLPVSLPQANFIQGGLILSWCIFHMFGDGKTFLIWTKIWAEECRRAQGLQITDPFKLDEAFLRDRQRIMSPTGKNPGRAEDHPEYTIIPFTPESMPPKILSEDHRGQIFYFSPGALARLKAEASPENATEPTKQRWVSTNDALSALLWRTVMAVQSPLETLEGDPVSVFNIAVDARLRTDPPVHPETMGCFLGYVAASVPIRKMLGSASLADLAILVRQALIRADNQFVDDVATLIDTVEDVNRIIPTALLDVPGNNCIQTSWVNFSLYDVQWGQVLGDTIQAVRAPHVGVINGLQVVMPILPDGGMEILVGVEKDCLDRLLHEPLWMKYAETR
ncbi:transferase family-domain-containing protein [Colletotrichum godetiae]|uniref:Transferase family-domain-containing protein n=1 Tax=Colletotrichum godetiae TaxID=1209918 RepID=A0AAJ0AQR4_9PEZI|nr:transferase family-domain-containing protein [Colletotrichum godetiae]KAK1676802.1 transferase family-domain-containing protein [Colletotrichum godetiae]